MHQEYGSKIVRPSGGSAKAGIGPGAGGGSVFANAPPRGTGVHSAFNPTQLTGLSTGRSVKAPPAARPGPYNPFVDTTPGVRGGGGFGGYDPFRDTTPGKRGGGGFGPFSDRGTFVKRFFG